MGKEILFFINNSTAISFEVLKTIISDNEFLSIFSKIFNESYLFLSGFIKVNWLINSKSRLL